MHPAQLLPPFDAFLAARGLQLEAIIAGGAALALLGIAQRETRDFDLIEPSLSEALLEASRAPLLPEGWRSRLQPVFQGQALHLWSLGRPELLLAKLWALCDRGLDLPDCLALAPSPEELSQAASWIACQDLHPDWPSHVQATLEKLARRLGHGL